MATLLRPDSSCCCPLVSADPPAFVPQQLTQKHITLQQAITFKRELDSSSKNPHSSKKKISLTELKRHKEARHAANIVSDNCLGGYQKANPSNISVMRENDWQSKRQDTAQLQITKSTRILPETTGVYSNFPKTVFQANVIARVPTSLHTTGPFIQNTTLYKLQTGVSVQQRHPNKFPILEETHLKPYQRPLLQHPPINIYHQFPRTYLTMQESHELSAFVKSGKQTFISTNPSHDNILIKQAQSIYGEPQPYIMSPSSRSYKVFPQGFRKAQSLEDDESSKGQVSIVLDQYSIPQRQDGVQTERVSIQVRQMSRKKSQTERRSTGMGSIFADR